MKEASFYEKLEGEKVRCLVCNHRCLIKSGARGICGVRENRGGTLISLVYRKIIARHCDPIEKKPLFHFLPGTSSYSVATVGCNFRCTFCQNADISQMPSDRNRIMGEDMTPEEIIGLALNCRAASISYTYTEPTIYFETALETAQAAVARGLKNVFVSNGYMTRDCLEAIHPNLHAANVDLKSFSDRFYKEQCGARLKPVLNTIGVMREMGIVGSNHASDPRVERFTGRTQGPGPFPGRHRPRHPLAYQSVSPHLPACGPACDAGRDHPAGQGPRL